MADAAGRHLDLDFALPGIVQVHLLHGERLLDAVHHDGVDFHSGLRSGGVAHDWWGARSTANRRGTSDRATDNPRLATLPDGPAAVGDQALAGDELGAWRGEEDDGGLE